MDISVDVINYETQIIRLQVALQGLIETMQRCKAEGKVWEGVVVHNRKGQDPISVEMKVMPVFDAEGNKYACNQFKINSFVQPFD